MSNPADPKKPNPDRTDPPSEPQGSGSMFEFTLPDGALPPVPPPDAGPGPFEAPPAPPPEEGNPFRFGGGSRGSFGDFGLPPAPPAEVPPLELESADLPGVDDLDQPLGEDFLLPEPPAEPAPDHLALADIDLSDATLEAVPVAGDAPAGLGDPVPLAAEEIPTADDALDLANLLDTGGSSVRLSARPAGTDGAPSSFSLGTLDLPDEVPVAELEAEPAPASGSVPDVSVLRPAAPVSSGSTPELPTAPRAGSFDFEFPGGVSTFSELPPVPGPDENGSKGDFETLPPRPAAVPRDASFDFINVPSARSLPEIVPPAEPVADSKVALGRAEPVDPVAPASGWLDAGPASASDLPFASPGTSDIFAGTPVKPAEPVETSDVLSATSGAAPAEPAAPPEPVRPSDVALTFNAPPGGSTLQDGDFDDLPLADGEDDLGVDSESIHEMPALGPGHPLFDSGQLANAPDLPAGARDPDAPEYGAPPVFTPDASSILADLTAPDLGLDDASSVRVEAPGVGRTLNSDPPEAAFELTVPEEPLPADLFEDVEEGSGSGPTNWEDQSGSDLLAGRTAAPDDGTVEPVDIDLFSEDPSLSSAPSSIFSGVQPVGGSGGSAPPPDATVAAPPLGAGSGSRPAVPNIDSRDFELPGARPGAAGDEADEAGQVDFDFEAAADAEHTQAAPPGASLSAIIRDELGDRLTDDSEEMVTRTVDPDAATEEPEVSLDYLADSNESSALALPIQSGPAKGKAQDKGRAKKGRTPEPAPAPTRTKPTRVAPVTDADADGTGTEEPTLPGKKGSGLLIGALVGALAAGGAWAGLYFGDVIPNAKPGSGSGPVASNGTKPPVTPGPENPAAPAALDPGAAFAAGNAARAVEHYKTNAPTTLTEKTDAGFVRVFAKAQALAPGATAPANDADLAAARKDLEEVIAKPDAVAEPGGVKRGVKASVALGASYELAGDLKAARKVYTDAAERYPAYKATFEAHLDRLDALEAPAPKGTSRRPARAELELLLAAVLLVQDPPKADEVEPGVYYWKAVKAANAGKYKEALELIDQAKAAHQKLAPAFSGRGINPLSDPREQIFAKTCDELKAYWKLRGAVSGNPDMIAELNKDGGALAKALDGFAKSGDAAAKAEKDATAARLAVKKLEGEVEKLGKDVKASDAAKLEAEKSLEKAKTDLKTAETKLATAATDLKAAEKDVESKQAALASLAEVLKPVAPVPEKWGPADLVAATKALAGRATGPDLKALVPDAMTAIAGGGLSAGQFLDIAARLNKAEAAAKDALAKLTAETKRLTDTHAAETKKLKDDHAAEVKTLTATYATDLKKLNDAHAEAVKKLKDGGAEELKKLTDKYAADAKKLTDDYAATLTKLKEEHAVALKAEQDKTEAEKKRAAAREIEFQKQLAGAVTPGQVMDLWVPILTDLRRTSDTGPALAAAQKALAGSVPDSEDAAKAQTVAGLAYLVRGDLERAKEMFQAARRSPAHKAATGKPWAVAADTGLEAVTDPSAPLRRPVAAAPVDLRAAAASLDVGITAYKRGRYDAAVTALLDAAKNNPADPVAWYFLGAARLALGNSEQAEKDFAQGADRERASAQPSRETSDALSPIQGPARAALDRARP